MNIFSSAFVEHLGVELGVDARTVSLAIESFFAPKETIKQVFPEKKVIPPRDVGDHTCERIPRGKKVPCGRKAKNCIDDDSGQHWYCGTEKSGCYKSVLGSKKRVKKSKAVASTLSFKSKATPSTLAEAKAISNAKSEVLMKTVLSKSQIGVKPGTVGGKKVWMSDDGIVFDHETSRATGQVDGEKIVALSDKNKRVLEASGASIESDDDELDDLVNRISLEEAEFSAGENDIDLDLLEE